MALSKGLVLDYRDPGDAVYFVKICTLTAFPVFFRGYVD